MKRLLIVLLLLATAALAAIYVVNFRVATYSNDRLKTIEGLADEPRVGIVFGARVYDDGAPSNTLYDRTLIAAEAYNAGKVNKLLLSGGNLEPEVMKKLAVELGVPESAIVTDAAGLRTYDTCNRAKNVFGVDRAVLFTQDYHQARSIYLCSNMGIDSVGVDTKRREYLGERWLWVREYLSRVGAWYDVNFRSFPENSD